MKKYLVLATCSLFLAGCQSSMTGSHSTENDGTVMLHHAEDTKGRSHFPMQRAATGKKVFIFDPKATAWAAYDASGRRVKTGRASGGAAYCADVGKPCRTVTGKFAVYRKQGAECQSSRFPLPNGGAPMPHCMHFKGGYAVHGSSHVPNYNASHGCVRVLPSAARWLNQDFLTYGSTVIIRPY